ncbi:hypothetical protein K432DRAFT_378575 [Lepidopterella palustris CBS 459.81]|uniref:Uncharacterized protein n=1 Tax=Lepidopterella palustris CBS 459.81 TaxID=1314670 RepID=A0A8E2EIL0_9PEZI|nr:hypothetical protein K432DRAFT_378575 [Lepidopterella palustris CBS 459.81]
MARNPSTHVGLLTHGDSYGSLLDSRVIQRQALEPAKAEMADLLNDASAIGEEHYEEALVQAETMLKSFKSSYPNAGRRIILIGDGGCEFDDTGYAYGRPLVPWKKQCERLSNEGVPVHSIVVNPSDSYYSGGLPSSKDKHMLATISELTRGKSFSPVNAYDSAVFDSYEIAGRIPPKEPSTPSRASSISSASLMSPTVETRSTHRSTISVERFPVASSTVATVGRKSSNTPTPVPAPPPKPRGRLFKLGSTFDKRSRRGDSKTHP